MTQTGDDYIEIDVAKDYETGRVVLINEDGEASGITPQQAREFCDVIENGIANGNVEDVPAIEQLTTTIRSYADDVEGSQ